MKNNRFFIIFFLLFMIFLFCIYPSQPIPKILDNDFQKHSNENWLSNYVYNRLYSSIEEFEKISKDEYLIEQLDEEELASFATFVVSLAILGCPTDPEKNAVLWQDIEDLFTDDEEVLSCNFKYKNYYPNSDNFAFAENFGFYEILQCKKNFFEKIGSGVKKGVKATGRAIKNGAKEVCHAVKKVGEFVVDHKEKVLVGIGIAAGVAVGTMVVCKIVEENKVPPTPASVNNNFTSNTIIDNQVVDNSSSSLKDKNSSLETTQSQNNPAAFIEFQNPIPDNKLPPEVLDQISALKDSINTQYQLYSNNSPGSPSIDLTKEISKKIGPEIAHTILDIASTTGIKIKDATSLVTHKILGGIEGGVNLLNLVGNELQKEMVNVCSLMFHLSCQDLNLGTDLKNNQNTKNAFVNAHEKVDEFFSTDFANNYNMSTSDEISTGYIPFFPPSEGAVIAGRVLKTFKTIEQETALAEDLSISAKEIAIIDGQITDKTISNIAKGNFVKNEGNLINVNSPEKNIVDEIAIQLKQWLQEDYRVITNDAGDKVFLSKDGLRKIRFEFDDTYPHKNVHSHIEIKINNEWVKSGPIYPADVSHE